MTNPEVPRCPAPIRTLVVDDSRLWLEQMCKLLMSRAQFSVVGTAANGADAVSLVQELRPELVLLDVQMPVMNGFEAVAAIRIHQPKVRVLMMSADNESWVRRGCYAHGADAFVSKAGGPFVLLQTISDLFADRAPVLEHACDVRSPFTR